MLDTTNIKNLDSVMYDIERAGFGGQRIVVDMNMRDNSLHAQPYGVYESTPLNPSFSDDRRIGVFCEPVSRTTIVSLCLKVYQDFWYGY